MSASNPSPDKNSSLLSLAIAWIVVAIPLGWGVYQTVVKSLPLFRMSSGAGASPASFPHQRR
jgi:hypothetical protein